MHEAYMITTRFVETRVVYDLSDDRLPAQAGATVSEQKIPIQSSPKVSKATSALGRCRLGSRCRATLRTRL